MKSANVLAVCNAFRASDWWERHDQQKSGLKRFSRSRKNAKVACFREVVAQEWDSQLDLKVVLAGAGGYALREHMSLKGKGGLEVVEKSIREEQTSDT